MTAINHHQSFLRSLSSIHGSEGLETPPVSSRRTFNKSILSRRSSLEDPICVSNLPPLPFGRGDDACANCQIDNNVSRQSGLSRRSTLRRRHSQDAMVRPESILRQSSHASPLQHKRRASVSFMYRENGTLMTQESSQDSQPRQKHRGLRKDYSLGKSARSHAHMIIESDCDAAFESASSLNNHDFAFVKRSDGEWTYAILAYRSFEKVKNEDGQEECMTFVMSYSGSTKMIKKRHWGEFIRLVHVSSEEVEETVHHSHCHVKDTKSCLIPRSVSIPSNDDGEYSVISDVSVVKH